MADQMRPSDNPEVDQEGRTYEMDLDPQHPTSPAPSARPQDRSDPYTRLPQDTPPGTTPGADGAGSVR